jgi:adenine-specific DNA-methyltransferase
VYDLSATTVDGQSERKARGAFFTPPELVDYLVRWGIRTADDRVLEPSCGEAAFLLAAARRLRALGQADSTGQLRGVELHGPSAASAKELLASAGAPASIAVGDFFDFNEPGSYDAVLGNPPYVRYQGFAGEMRERALAVASASSVALTQLASSWAAFVVHAAGMLRPGGRLGLVLPAELLSVNYAGPIRRFLLERFASVRIVTFERRVFPGVLEEVVLLLAEGSGPSASIHVSQARDAEHLAVAPSVTWTPPSPEAKWSFALIPIASEEAYARLVSSDDVVTLEDWGAVSLQIVSGGNRFFALSAEDAARLDLPQHELLRLSPPGSRHLRQLVFSQHGWRRLRDAGQRAFLFYPGDQPSRAALNYIEEGERSGVADAYKCRIRMPRWWRVPLLPPPDLIFTYMNHEAPSLVSNTAKARCLNSVHGVTLRPELRELGGSDLPLAFLNSLTLLGGELIGRAYGGGLLKLEPREAARLPVPSPRRLAELRTPLAAIARDVRARLAATDLRGAIGLVDGVVLGSADPEERRALREGRRVLSERRYARGQAD